MLYTCPKSIIPRSEISHLSLCSILSLLVIVACAWSPLNQAALSTATLYQHGRSTSAEIHRNLNSASHNNSAINHWNDIHYHHRLHVPNYAIRLRPVCWASGEALLLSVPQFYGIIPLWLHAGTFALVSELIIIRAGWKLSINWFCVFLLLFLVTVLRLKQHVGNNGFREALICYRNISGNFMREWLGWIENYNYCYMTFVCREGSGNIKSKRVIKRTWKWAIMWMVLKSI